MRDSLPDRGQAHTLEAVAAAILLLGSLTFALQVTAVTPLSASTSNQHIENQQAATVEGVIESARESGALYEAALYWNDSAGNFHDADRRGFTTNEDVRRIPLGSALAAEFAERGVAFNVRFRYQREDGQERTVQYIYRGQPSDNAVTRKATVTLYEDDPLIAADRSPTSTTVNESSLYASNADPSSNLYNVIRVEVTVWRM